MDVHTLISEISHIGETQVGRGPKHPTSPNRALVEEIEAYFRRYPFLKQDEGYVDFMESYAGLYVLRPEYGIAVDVFGFADVSSELIRMQDDFFVQGENNVFEDGYLAFCDASYIPSGLAPEEVTLFSAEGGGFAFYQDAYGQLAVYRAAVSGPELNIVKFESYCSSFLKWLEILLELRGLFPSQ